MPASSITLGLLGAVGTRHLVAPHPTCSVPRLGFCVLSIWWKSQRPRRRIKGPTQPHGSVKFLPWEAGLHRGPRARQVGVRRKLPGDVGSHVRRPCWLRERAKEGCRLGPQGQAGRWGAVLVTIPGSVSRAGSRSPKQEAWVGAGRLAGLRGGRAPGAWQNCAQDVVSSEEAATGVEAHAPCLPTKTLATCTPTS